MNDTDAPLSLRMLYSFLFFHFLFFFFFYFHFPTFCSRATWQHVPGQHIMSLFGTSPVSGCASTLRLYSSRHNCTCFPLFSASITKSLRHLTASVAHVCLLPWRSCRPVACCLFAHVPDFVLHITVTWSSTGPTLSEMVFEVSASLLQPSGTNFRHTFQLRTLTISTRLMTRVCEHLLVGGASVNICLRVVDKWTYRLIDRKSDQRLCCRWSMSSRNKFFDVTTTARRKQWMRREAA